MNPDACQFENLDKDFDEKLQLSAKENLRKGIVSTEKKEFTILVVGETGTGKTSLLSLIANILVGRKPKEYRNEHDDGNEAGGGPKHSQTNSARVYHFTSNNGIKVNILDAPGLADTRGLTQDELHKASIANAIKDNVTTVNGVLIIANGTVPRLGVATDYALSTLSSIFPHTLGNNIGVLFTNVANTLSWNFSMPEILRGKKDNQWLLDNPLAMWNKYLKISKEPNANKKLLSVLMRSINKAHDRALENVASIFEWLDGLVPQPTKDIVNLYEQCQKIDRDIEYALSIATQLSEKKKKLVELKDSVRGSELTMKQYGNYRSVIACKVWVQESTWKHNTLCSEPNCYSNCHIDCELGFSLDARVFFHCWTMNGNSTCSVCHHSYMSHRHYNSRWIQEDRREEKIDWEAEQKYNEAKRSKNDQERMIVDLDVVIADLDKDIERALTSLSELIESYAKLSLSGSFAVQIEKSVLLMEATLEAMRNNQADLRSVDVAEKSLEKMRQRLRIVEEASAKMGRHRNL